MILSNRLASLALAAAVLAGCGVTDQQALEPSQQGTQNGDDQYASIASYLQDDVASTSDESLPEEEAVTDADDAERPGRVVFETLMALHDTLRNEVAECGGFSAEAAALEELRQSLPKGKDVSKEEKKEAIAAMRDDLVAAHKALREKLAANRDKIKECLEAQRDSEIKLAIDTIHESCLSIPSIELHDGVGGKGRKPLPLLGKKRGRAFGPPRPGQHPLPPPPFLEERFESQECQDALAKGSSLI